MKFNSTLALFAAAGLLSASTALAQTNTNPSLPPASTRRGPTFTAQARLAALEHALGETNKLSETQKTKVKDLFEAQSKKLQELQGLPPEDARSKRQEINTETNKKLKEILTPEQYKAFEAAPHNHGPHGPHAGGQSGTPGTPPPAAGQ